MDTVLETSLSSIPLAYRGKVRDLYKVNDNSLLMVTSDRLSAFDQIFHKPIPNKGRILTALSTFWFNKIEHIAPNHLLSLDPESVVSLEDDKKIVRGRSVVVKKLQPIAIESVVRGYLAGGGLKEYMETGAVSGISLPKNIKSTDALSEPIWTPSIKIYHGGHDQSCSFAYVANLVGHEMAEKIRSISITIYNMAYDYVLAKGLILADTKMEFGLDENHSLYIMDELLTPDSSRYWLRNSLEKNNSPFSLDKQYIRDYWRKMSYDQSCLRLPDVPDHIISELSHRYETLYDIISGHRVIT
ncbi:phosphoribosylaminoimidazolesuccinocarboxamide synthase [Candidatus Ichthyocystis hellenicum]|uniref:phosphoribosylaminoimidazolesuccinocarboxamide synthase n=1 Tax=Candidatus Ichthyocystis hellenicum TaxID=1561003 RepID=UPI000A6A11E9|nr:phosphoribosylaminoimidazolesuccinocarboxamide synthase [Candidatus Ichthyocystis hellenicum]